MSEDIKTALDAAEKELQDCYRKVWPLREAYAESFPPAELPPPRYRTAKQEKVARCPRCGGSIQEREESMKKPGDDRIVARLKDGKLEFPDATEEEKRALIEALRAEEESRNLEQQPEREDEEQ